MPDITTVWEVGDGVGDWVMAGPDLQSGSDLETAILISLFTDRTAEPDDAIPDGSADPRGWWVDAGEAYPIGSRLWLLQREKQVAKVPVLAVDYANEALKWLVDDGVCSRIDVTASFFGPGQLGLTVTAWQPGLAPTVLNYGWVWTGVN